MSNTKYTGKTDVEWQSFHDAMNDMHDNVGIPHPQKGEHMTSFPPTRHKHGPIYVLRAIWALLTEKKV